MTTTQLGTQLKLGSNQLLRKVAFGVLVAAILALALKYFAFDQQRYLVPASAVAQGQDLSQVRWSAVSVNLGSISKTYVTSVPSGFASQSLSAGQLVAKSAVLSQPIGQTARVVVATKTQLGQGITAGAKVAVWSAERLQGNQFDAPKRIVEQAVVARVLKPQAMFANQSQQVELIISPIQTPIVLSALATDSAIFLVAQQ